MKNKRLGQARVLSTGELDLLNSKLRDEHHRIVAEVCRRTACRVGEAVQLRWGMISESAISFPKQIVKGKLTGRQVPATEPLRKALRAWRAVWVARQGREPERSDFLVPGRYAGSCLSTRAFMRELERAAAEAGLEGVSTHSYRRSSLTAAHASGIPLAVLCSLSGHRSLSSLQRYLAVSEEQREAAAAAFA